VFYAYLLQSEKEPDQRYVGFTTDLKDRLKPTNPAALLTPQNTNHGNWSAIHAFANERQARELE
jgi:predicted GIY-YIG superfamily endonuclease